MPTTNDYLVIDKNGKRARRSGILLDGDTMTVPARFMDHASPELQAAMAAADSAKRIEQFVDAKTFVGHRPGFAIVDTAAQDASELSRQARKKAISDAWKHPPPVVDRKQPIQPASASTNTTSSHDELIRRRDARISNTWRGA